MTIFFDLTCRVVFIELNDNINDNLAFVNSER